jgi:hypothetical protein
MENVTGEQVRDAMIAAGIESVDHHPCGGCSHMVQYFREGDNLFFDPSCKCIAGNGPEPRSWDDAADWINKQSHPEAKVNIAKRFGFTA